MVGPTIRSIGNSRVLESREVSDGQAIRRRRMTPEGTRFTTYERVEAPNLAVVKKDGTRELFDRTKLVSAIRQSVGKFFASDLAIDEIVSAVEARLYRLGEHEVTSRQIGDQVLDELARRNEVAYVRFASVYYEFTTLDEFEAILAQRRQQSETKEA